MVTLKSSKNQYKNYALHLFIYFISFALNYIIFLIGMLLFNNKLVGMHLINLISFILSMLFIFYVDKKYVPDLVDENNSSELLKFILLRIFGLIFEAIILYIFISILDYKFYFIKFIGLFILFILNSFCVKKFKYKV